MMTQSFRGPVRTRTRFLAASLLVAAPFFSIASCQAQNAPNAQAPNDEVKDQGNVAPRVGTMTGYPAEAPVTVPLARSNYPVPRDAIFVAPDGRDTNAGASIAAPTTLARALEIAPVNSTIVLRGGVYRAGTLSLKRKLTIQAYPEESPLLLGSIVVEGWVPDTNANGRVWRRDGWKGEFPNQLNPRFVDVKKNPLAANRDMTFVDGRPLWQVGSLAEVRPGAFFVDYAGDKLYIGDDPAGKVVESTTHGVAFTLARPRPSDPDSGAGIDPAGSVVRGLSFGRYANQGVILARANGVLLENNAFFWNGQMGAAVHESADVVLRGNRFTCNGRSSLSGNDATRMLLENNTFSYSNIEGYSTSWDAAGVKLTRSNTMIWRCSHSYRRARPRLN